MRQTLRRGNNGNAQTWKQKLGSLGSRARLYGNERWLRSGKRQEGNDLVDPDGCRTWHHIFRHRRSLWDVSLVVHCSFTAAMLPNTGTTSYGPFIAAYVSD